MKPVLCLEEKRTSSGGEASSGSTSTELRPCLYAHWHFNGDVEAMWWAIIYVIIHPFTSIDA